MSNHYLCTVRGEAHGLTTGFYDGDVIATDVRRVYALVGSNPFEQNVKS